MPTTVHIAKWGNSLGIRIPRDIAARAGLSEGTRVDVDALPDGRISIAKSTRRLSLAELLAGMNPENEHLLEDDGPRGEEML